MLFDAAATIGRFAVLRKAIEAGKHIYAEKPIMLVPPKRTAARRSLPRIADAAAHQTRNRCAGQTVPARLRKPALMVSRSGLLRPRIPSRFGGGYGPLGFRRGSARGPASELELPEERRRRTCARYVSTHYGGICWTRSWDRSGTIRLQLPQLAGNPQNGSMRPAFRFDVDVEDSVSAQLEFENGAVGTIVSSWATRDPKARKPPIIRFISTAH